MKKGLNIRLYPNIVQQKLAEKTFGATRFVYNHILGLKKKNYGKNIGLHSHLI